jgi:hypothetical protein
MHRHANQLVEELLQGGTDDSAHQLLEEFFRGYPVHQLRRLLDSADERVAKVGAWIASELGPRAIPLLDTFPALLSHPSRYVRFFVLDAVLVCATEADGDLLGRAIQLLRDKDDAVRWKALTFVAKASLAQLEASVSQQGDTQLAALSSWLVRLEGSSDSAAQVTAKLGDVDELERLVAAAGAYRLSKSSPHLLKLASESDDSEVASFAAEQLKLVG